MYANHLGALCNYASLVLMVVEPPSWKSCCLELLRLKLSSQWNKIEEILYTKQDETIESKKVEEMGSNTK